MLAGLRRPPEPGAQAEPRRPVSVDLRRLALHLDLGARARRPDEPEILPVLDHLHVAEQGVLVGAVVARGVVEEAAVPGDLAGAGRRVDGEGALRGPPPVLDALDRLLRALVEVGLPG